MISLVRVIHGGLDGPSGMAVMMLVAASMHGEAAAAADNFSPGDAVAVGGVAWLLTQQLQ
jgi:hypothetical protein